MEWTAFGGLLLVMVGQALRQESRMTKTEVILENSVKLLERLDDARLVSRANYKKLGSLRDSLERKGLIEPESEE